MADATQLEKKYIYQISRSGVFLGVLQDIQSEFTIQQDINTAGVALQIEVANTADRQFEATEQILTEEGLPITDELGQPLLTERQPDIVGNANGKALIRNNNTIAVYEVSPDYPNGKIVFSGWISRWKASYGNTDNIVINCLSNGSELDNYLILGAQTVDQSQASQNNTAQAYSIYGGKASQYQMQGQTFTPGTGITSLSAILLKLAASNTVAQTVSVKLWQSPADFSFGNPPLATTSLTISSTSPADYTFTFPTPVLVNAGQSYFFSIQADDGGRGNGVLIYFQTSDVYAGGDMYGAVYPGFFALYSGLFDLYFKTYYTAGATSSPYSSQDPTAILRSIVDGYVNRGGTINYASGTTVLTNTSRSYTFKVNTILEGIKKCLELAPFDWYWYIAPGTNVLYFKETSTTADHKMIYGRHIQSLDIQASAEEVKTQAYFTGGDTGGNVYLYQSLASSAAVLAANAGRVGMIRMNDNRVTLSDTATALMTNFLAGNNAENYQSSITVNAKTYDVTLFNPGATIGFAGFGSFVDNLILQIVHIEYHGDYVVLGLGKLPRRASAQVEDINRTLNDVTTIYNPSTPS